MALATRPRMLLLDEVAAGLTESEVEEMARLHPRACATSSTSPWSGSSTR